MLRLGRAVLNDALGGLEAVLMSIASRMTQLSLSLLDQDSHCSGCPCGSFADDPCD